MHTIPCYFIHHTDSFFANKVMLDTNQDKDKIKLIFNYTKNFIKIQSNTICHLDLKHSFFLGFSIFLLRFTLDLPDRIVINSGEKIFCNLYLVLKILICFLTTLSILLSAYSLNIAKVYKVLDPKELLEDNKFKEKEEETISTLFS